MAHQFLCDDCQRPINPHQDNHINVGEMTICFNGKVGRFALQFCCDEHFVSWLKKHGKPSSLIQAQNMNPLQGPLS